MTGNDELDRERPESGERALEVGTFVGVEGVERVGGGESPEGLDRRRPAGGCRLGASFAIAILVVVGHVVTPNACLRRIIPSRSRVFTVPSGTSSRSAISDCVRPP